MNAPQIVAVHIIAHTNHSRGIFKQAAGRATVAKRITRWQIEAAQGHYQGINNQILLVLQHLLAIRKTEQIAAAHASWTKGMHATSITDDGIAPRDAFVPARAEEILQDGSIRDRIDAHLASVDGQRTRDCIFYLQPGQRQQLGILNHH